MRVGFDATPLLGVRTGVGRYAEHLLRRLAAGPEEMVATAFTLRGRGDLPAAVPHGVPTRTRPVSARLLQELWARAEIPPVEWLVGRVDVFHATNFVLPPLRRAAGVVTVHDLSFLRTPETVTSASLRYRTLVPRSVRRAAVVCTPSEAVAEEVRAEYGLPAERVLATPLGVDEAWFDVPAPDAGWRAGLGLPDRYAVFAGTLEPRKDLPTLLAAFGQVLDHDGEARLVLAGPAGWGPALATAGLPAGSVTTTGYLPTEDLRRVVAGAACLVLPSRYEGFGIPLLEAFACGTPVITTDLPVTREVTGGLARMFPVGDADALAGELAAVLAGTPDAAERDKRRAWARTFTWDRCAAATREAYARAAG